MAERALLTGDCSRAGAGAPVAASVSVLVKRVADQAVRRRAALPPRSLWVPSSPPCSQTVLKEGAHCR